MNYAHFMENLLNHTGLHETPCKSNAFMLILKVYFRQKHAYS